MILLRVLHRNILHLPLVVAFVPQSSLRACRKIILPLCFGVILLLGVPGCVQLSNGKPPGPWHEAYQPINDPETEAFVAQSLGKGIDGYGEPVVRVNKVLIRRSRKLPEAQRYRIGEDFSLTECVDSTNGLFVIYLAVDPEHRNYFALLGHECAHLLNPYIFDWYMEGFATVFSEQMCGEAGREWGDWKRHFEKTRREPYGLSYRMMLELQQEFPDEYPSIIRYTAENGDGSGRLHIDINAWLETLPTDRCGLALDIISDYTDALRRNTNEQYQFNPPAGTK